MVSPQPHIGIEDETTRHFEEPLDRENGAKLTYMYQEAGDYEDQSSFDLYNMNPFDYHFETINWDDMDEE